MGQFGRWTIWAECVTLVVMHAKILIVDDDDITRRVVDHIVRRAGFETVAVCGGQEAMDCLADHEFDVAVVDLMMPGIDGFAVLDHMRKHAPGVVPVVLSATSSLEDALRTVQEGAFDFVSKPVDNIDVFIHRIERAVEHKRLRDSHAELLEEVKRKNAELENRLGQLELAHSILQSQAVAIQIDLNRAMRIQQGLLPRELPFSDRISLTTVYEPLAKVGGDLYDVFAVDDTHVGICLADTSGHGVSSALLTVFLKHAFDGVRARSSDGIGGAPGEVLTELNHIILDEAFGQGIFVSMCYLVLNVDTGKLKYSNAGHPPMLRRRAAGGVERLRTPAPVLGVNPAVVYAEDECVLGAGDMLVMYTDGIPESRDASGAFFGEERLKSVIAGASPHADAIADAVQRDVHAFTEGRQRTDDLTLLVLGAEPQTTPFRVPREGPVKTPEGGKASVKVLKGKHDNCVFISVSGTGSWRESQQVLNLCREACEAGEQSIILDLTHCNHLDSTFLGVLHNIVTGVDEKKKCRFELQNLSRVLLREMSDLGLTGVLMHFRHAPIPLPRTMAPVDDSIPGGGELGRVLLWAHEALVEADPKNADRFAAVLQVLHDRAREATAQGTPPEEPES